MKATGARILLIEDNADDEALALEAFDAVKIKGEVAVVRDGQEAIEYLLGSEVESPPPLPIFVILDLKLPKVPGLEVLSRIRSEARTRLVPIVVFTSSHLESDKSEAYARGANSFVRKPVEFGRYVDVLGQIGVYWLKLNEYAQGKDGEGS